MLLSSNKRDKLIIFIEQISRLFNRKNKSNKVIETNEYESYNYEEEELEEGDYHYDDLD